MHARGTVVWLCICRGLHLQGHFPCNALPFKILTRLAALAAAGLQVLQSLRSAGRFQLTVRLAGAASSKVRRACFGL